MTVRATPDGKRTGDSGDSGNSGDRDTRDTVARDTDAAQGETPGVGSHRRAVGRWGRAGAGFALGCGLLGVLPVLAAMVALARSGWGPNLDEAANAWRAYDQTAGHGVLVGPITQATNALGRSVYDPGPALYWALAIPTRLAPQAGPLVGVALVAVAAGLIGARAALSLGGRLAAVLVAAAMLVLTFTLADQLVVMPIWNPYLPLLPWLAALVVAVAVAAGRLRWWPVLLVLASFAVQSHLVYAPAGGLAVIAPLVGVANRRRSGAPVGRRWLLAGAAVLVVLWLPPVVQQFTGHPGNLGLLLRSTVLDHRAGLGTAAGLRELGGAVARPRWLRAPAPWDLQDVHGGSAAVGVLVLLGLAVTAAVWWRGSDPRRRALGTVTLVGTAFSVATIAGIAHDTLLAIVYLRFMLYPVGMLIWVTLAVAAGDLVRRLPAVRFAYLRAHAGVASGVAVAVLVVAAVGETVWLAPRTPGVASVLQGDRTSDVAAGRAVRALLGPPGRLVPGRRIEVALPDPGGHSGVARQLAIGYQLRVAGWTPTIADPAIAQLLAPVYRTRPGEPVVTLRAAPAPRGAQVLGTLDVAGTPMTVSLRR